MIVNLMCAKLRVSDKNSNFDILVSYNIYLVDYVSQAGWNKYSKKKNNL